MEQANGPLLANIALSVAPKPDPQTIRNRHPQLTSQTHESMYPQLDLPAASDPSARQGEASIHSPGASLPVPVAHTQPVSGSGAESENTTSDLVATLTTFSRLPPEQMRTLYPILGTIVVTQQSPEGVGHGSAPDAPPSYGD